jgi:hypothetical protein
MRIWAQLRAAGERGGRRWSRSLYVGPQPTLVQLPFDEFLPVDPSGASERLPLDEIESLLIVADTLNTLPGTSATIAISDLWLAK